MGMGFSALAMKGTTPFFDQLVGQNSVPRSLFTVWMSMRVSNVDRIPIEGSFLHTDASRWYGRVFAFD